MGPSKIISIPFPILHLRSQVVDCLGTATKTEALHPCSLQSVTHHQFTGNFLVLLAFLPLAASLAVLAVAMVMPDLWQFDVDLDSFVGNCLVVGCIMGGVLLWVVIDYCLGSHRKSA
jgi:hypothetical protein